jgi:hypothetical protein
MDPELKKKPGDALLFKRFKHYTWHLHCQDAHSRSTVQTTPKRYKGNRKGHRRKNYAIM